MLAVPRAARTGIVLFLLLSPLAAAPQVLPKPQVASAEGKPAPNFILKDEHSKTISLASMRGKRVLLTFYRGYW
jgi:cytochrome oxidase Cu insertion factor (SCO1/SenC/PrrC family)